MEADPEHQQNDADLGKLHRQPRVGDEPRREGTDENAREQITRDRRNLQPVRERPHQKRDAEPRDDGSDQRCVMRHEVLRKGRGREGSTQPNYFCCECGRPAACNRNAAPHELRSTKSIPSNKPSRTTAVTIARPPLATIAAIAAAPILLLSGLACAGGWIGHPRPRGGKPPDPPEPNAGNHEGY